MNNFSTCVALGFAFMSVQAMAESFDNSSVIALSNAGVGDAVLFAKIDSLPCSYDVSTDQIIRLKGAGVSNAIITAIVNRCTGAARAQGSSGNASDPLSKRPPGIYIDLGDGSASSLRLVRPINAGGAQISGNGSILFPLTANLAVPQASAQTTAPSAKPIFYFYFESADNKTGDFGTSASFAAQSPAEFVLVRMKVSAGQREMTIGKASPFKTAVGFDAKNTLQFSMSEIGDGIFRVEMNATLPSGQYGFVLRAGSDHYRIYDFTVR